MGRRGSFRTQFEFKGVDQIQRLMEGMDLRDQTKVLSDALEEAAEPIVVQSRANILSAGQNAHGDQALFRTGALYKAMGFVVRTYKNTGRLIAYIGARNIAYSGNVQKKKATVIRDTTPLAPGNIKVVPSKYIHLVHQGFDNKLTGTRVRGRPFLKDAFDARIDQAEWTLLSGCANALEKVWKRNVAKLDRALFKKSA